MAERGWVEVDELFRLTGARRPATVGRWVVDPDVLAAEQARLMELIEAATTLGLDVSGLDARERAVLDGLAGVRVGRGRATLGAAADPLAAHPFVARLEAAPFTPPPPTGVDPAELSELVRRGLVVQQGGIHFAPAAVDQAAERIATLLATHPEGVTVGQIREELGTSRKYAIPLLAVLDDSGRTRRRGDLRIAGPRLTR